MTRRLSDEEVSRLSCLVAAGEPFTEIARRLRRGVTTCWHTAIRLGLHRPRPHIRRGADFRDAILRLHGRGFSDVEIAAATGAHRQIVGQHRRKLGLSSNAWSDRRKARGDPNWFRPGQLNGRAAKLLASIGQTRIRHRRARGNWQQRMVKIRDDGPPQFRWIPFARHVWESVYGPVPPGTFVVHADGDTLNDDRANLRLMTRRDLFAWQKSVRPKMEAHRLAAVARTARARWSLYRARRAHRLADFPIARQLTLAEPHP